MQWKVLPQGKLSYEQNLCGPSVKAGQEGKFGHGEWKVFLHTLLSCVWSALDTANLQLHNRGHAQPTRLLWEFNSSYSNLETVWYKFALLLVLIIITSYHKSKAILY